jgi:formate-dependent nitrite reductase membrane component NrfD
VEGNQWLFAVVSGRCLVIILCQIKEEEALTDTIVTRSILIIAIETKPLFAVLSHLCHGEAADLEALERGCGGGGAAGGRWRRRESQGLMGTR